MAPPIRTRKAQAELKDIEPREVSPVDRPANGHPFLIVKSEGGPAAEDPMADKTLSQKTAPPAPTPEQMAQTPPPPPMAEAEKAPAPPASEPPAAEQETEVEGPALVLPLGAKDPLLQALTQAHGRIGQIVMMLQKATEADGAEMPSDAIVAIADAAGAMAGCVEPYLAKQAGAGMAAPPVQPAEGETVATKAEGGWTQEYIDSLSDWCFLNVEPTKDRDSDWRTLPLTNRHFPIRDHAGRLCLPMVVEAVNQIAAAQDPFLSAQKKRKLLLRLADMRLSEAAVAAYRDEPMAPETAAELLAVAEMIGGVGGMAAPAPGAPMTEPAAPAPGEQPVAQAASSAPVEEQMAAFAKACGDRVREIAKMAVAKTAVTKADVVKLAAISAEIKAAVAKLDPFTTGEEVDAEKAKAPPPPPAADPPAADPIGKAAPVDVATEVAKAVAAATATLTAEIASQKVALGKAQADLSATRTELAKANRRVPPSNVVPEDRRPVVKSDEDNQFGHVTDINEVIKAQDARSAQKAKQ